MKGGGKNLALNHKVNKRQRHTVLDSMLLNTIYPYLLVQ